MQFLSKIILGIFLLSMTTVGTASALEDTIENREKLARQFHRANPPSQIVDSAIIQISQSIKDEAERKRYVKAMQVLMDIEGVESMSLKALVDTFTTEELGFLVDIYSSPVGKKTLAKVSDYQKIVTPEITKRLDEALMKMHTGGGSDIK